MWYCGAPRGVASRHTVVPRRVVARRRGTSRGRAWCHAGVARRVSTVASRGVVPRLARGATHSVMPRVADVASRRVAPRSARGATPRDNTASQSVAPRGVAPRHRVISRRRRRPGVAPRPPRGITPRDIAPLARGIAPRCDITLYPRGITRGAASRCHTHNLFLSSQHRPSRLGTSAALHCTAHS